MPKRNSVLPIENELFQPEIRPNLSANCYFSTLLTMKVILKIATANHVALIIRSFNVVNWGMPKHLWGISGSIGPSLFVTHRYIWAFSVRKRVEK